MAESSSAAPETVRDLFNDPTFENFPFELKLERFQKAAKNDHAYQKMSDEGKKYAHQKLFATETKETAALAQTPQPTALATTQEKAASRERLGLEPEPPPETTESTSLLGTLGKGAVKGLEGITQLGYGAAQGIDWAAQKLGSPPQTSEQAERARKMATPIQSYVTGPLLSPDTPGYRTLEHVVENIVGTAAMTPVMRGLLPALAKGVPLTKELIEQSIHAGLAAIPGQGYKEAGGGSVGQMAIELTTTGITGLAKKLWTSLRDRPALIRELQSSLKQQDPNVIESIRTGKALEKAVPGYKTTLPELVPEANVPAATAKQLASDKPVEFGIPYYNQLKTNVRAGINKVKSLLGASDEAIIGKGIETAQQDVLAAEKHHEFLQGVHRDLETQERNLDNTGRQKIRDAQDRHYNTIVKAEADIQAAENAATQAKQAADRLVQDTKQQGVELDARLLKQHRDAEAEATRLKHDAQDKRTAALQESQDLHSGVTEEARTQTKEASTKVTRQEEALSHVQAQNEQDMTTALEHQRKTFAKGAAESEAGYREGAKTFGQKAREFYENAYERTFGKPKTRTESGTPGLMGERYNAFYKEHPGASVGDNEFNQKFLGQIRKDGDFETKLVDRLQERYEPDPLVQEIRNNVMQKVKDAGLDDADIMHNWLHNKGDATVPPQIISTPFNMQDMAEYRSQVLHELRNTPSTSMRRRTLNELLDVVDTSMEDMVRRSGDKDAFAQWQKINRDYRTEKLRYIPDTPGGLTTAKNPRTNLPFAPDEYNAKQLFGPAPATGTSLKDARHVEMFGQYMRDIDHAIEDGFTRGDFTAVAEAKRAKQAMIDHAKNEFYMAYHDPVTMKVNPEAAERWIRAHQPLIDQSNELKSIFATDKDRLRAIKEVKAINQGREAEAQGLLDVAKQEKKTTTEVSGERVSRSRKEQAEAKRAATKTGTTEERDIAKTLIEKKQGFEDLDIAQKEQERQVGLRKKEENVAAQQQLTEAQRLAQKEKREAGRGVVTETRNIENLKVDLKEKMRLSQENVKAAEDRAKETVEEWKKAFAGTGPFANPLNQDIAARKLGVQPNDFIERIEALSEKERRIAYDRFFAKSKNDPALKQAVLSGMWENFIKNVDVSKLDLKKDPKLISEFLKKNERIISENFSPQLVKDLKQVQGVFDRVGFAVGATTEGVPEKLKSLTRGQIRRNDYAAMAVARMAGFGYHTVGQIGIATEALLRMSKEGRARVLKEVMLNPNLARLIAQLENPNLQRTWKQSALAALIARSGVTASELGEE